MDRRLGRRPQNEPIDVTGIRAYTLSTWRHTSPMNERVLALSNRLLEVLKDEHYSVAMDAISVAKIMLRPAPRFLSPPQQHEVVSESA